MNTKNKKTIFVGLSGGVDSAVTAAILKKEGHNVVGVFIRTWQPDFIECSFRQDRLDAMRVASFLDIPFLECGAEAEYKKSVADYMIEEYRGGRTPNPDVMCNREIKFGVFWNFAKSHGADCIATGHYARVMEHKTQNMEHKMLKVAHDSTKDQTYFLYRLTSKDLEHVLFPIGHLKKTEVRKLAEKFGLPNAVKKDSQGVCMLGDLDLKKFLSHYIKESIGDVLNEQGEVIGYHDGAIYLTLGERHGFTITKKTPSDKPYYIVSKDIEKNSITVSMDKKASEIGAKLKIPLEKVTWIFELPKKDKSYTAQIRYHGEYLPCTVEDSSVVFFEPVLVASGQSVVIFDGDMCLGGGIVI